jgi:hypothetical protein
MKTTAFFFYASEAGSGSVYVGLLVNLPMPQLHEDFIEFMSSNMVHFLTFILICKNI